MSECALAATHMARVLVYQVLLHTNVTHVNSPCQLGLCRLQQKKLVAAIMEAWDYGMYVDNCTSLHMHMLNLHSSGGLVV